MANEQDMSSWTGLLHSSTKLFEQTAPSTQFPPLQRNLDQLEALSKKMKAKTLRSETPSQSIAATRLLAREGINAEQLARDLKSFELKTTYEDVFPAEAATVEEYLQQIHEMAMISAIEEAQKDNVKSFDDYMLKVLEDDWHKEKRDFLQSLTRISTLPRVNVRDSSSGAPHLGQIVPFASSSQGSAGLSSMEILPYSNKPVQEKKASVYAEAVKNLNSARERTSPFKPATAFKSAYESLNLQTAGTKSVNMQKIWHLLQTLMGEDAVLPHNVSERMSLVTGARRHLEFGHEKYVMETIQNHSAQAALGGAVGNLQRIRAFLRVRLRDYGVLDFDAADTRRQPPIDTTWQQIYFCLRTGYYDDARNVAQSSRASHHFAPQLLEWISTGGITSAKTMAAASEECEKILRMGDRGGRAAYDKKRLLLYAIISGSRKQIDRLLRDLPNLFNTIEDFLWFQLCAVRDGPSGSSAPIMNDLVPYTVYDLQTYLNKFEPSYYTKNGKDPLVYPYVLLLSVQLLPAVLYLSKETGDEGFNIDAVHIAITLADRGILSEAGGAGQKLGPMDAVAEASSIIRQYGSAYLRVGNLSMALEYFVQAAAGVGGGQLSWTGSGGSLDQQRQRSLMLKQLLTELLLRDGGIYLLLGQRGCGEEGELRRFLPDATSKQQFLLEAARQCLEAGLYDKAIEIHKRVGAYAMALDTVNKCLAEAISALLRGRLDGQSRIAGLIHSGNEIVETYNYYPETSLQAREHVLEQQTVLRQLEIILSIHENARSGHHLDVLKEIAKLPFLPLDPRAPDISSDVFQNLSPYVQACVPDVLRVALTCLDNVTDTDGSLRALRTKIANFLANNLHQNWPRDLYEMVARTL